MTTIETVDFPAEVVTKALVRFVELPLQAGKAALITLDNGLDHTRPTTFGPRRICTAAHTLRSA